MSARATMPMPEAAVDEHHASPGRKHNIRSSGQVFSVQPETIPDFVEHRSYQKLRSGVPPADTGHYAASFLLRENIHRCRNPRRRTRFVADVFPEYRLPVKRKRIHAGSAALCPCVRLSSPFRRDTRASCYHIRLIFAFRLLAPAPLAVTLRSVNCTLRGDERVRAS
jgi:hypothetical protein